MDNFKSVIDDSGHVYGTAHSTMKRLLKTDLVQLFQNLTTVCAASTNEKSYLKFLRDFFVTMIVPADKIWTLEKPFVQPFPIALQGTCQLKL